jgi:hypothetical protein
MDVFRFLRAKYLSLAARTDEQPYTFSRGIFRALTSKGLELPAHTSEVGSNLASDKHYDQIAFFPGATKDCFKQMGVFDFDSVVFRTLWNDAQRSPADFRAYVRYYLSDHRPLWMELGCRCRAGGPQGFGVWSQRTGNLRLTHSAAGF